ncbi:hypothetical protein WUBG_13297 [Wuchereria bancrofti]|uniref:G-protein coupled receptors family 1 profile domain-containing protein n=1 Tax=Wuchereria bancrofti TaxID=6293 RepID=J9ANC4_WUCBA|nr:hypothetical protein WUBG_13297 [Wuchereria bancrofti]
MLTAKSRFKRERERRKTISYSQRDTKIQGQCGNLLKSKTEINADMKKGNEMIQVSTNQTFEGQLQINGKNQQKKMNASMRKRKGYFKENAEMRRERRAWRTLAIITGTFVACWTPFFLLSLYRPICRCRIPILLESITNWLGYLNSALNPIIYTVFSNDFRTAFKRILARLLFLKMSRS